MHDSEDRGPTKDPQRTQHEATSRSGDPVDSSPLYWIKGHLSQASFVFSLIAVTASVFSFASANWAREQDNQIAYMHMLAEKMYDAELADNKLLCIYGKRYASLGCGEVTTLHDGNLAYAALALDLLQESEQYHRRWCSGGDIWSAIQTAANLDDCSLYDGFARQIIADEMKVFSGLAKAHFAEEDWFQVASDRLSH